MCRDEEGLESRGRVGGKVQLCELRGWLLTKCEKVLAVVQSAARPQRRSVR